MHPQQLACAAAHVCLAREHLFAADGSPTSCCARSQIRDAFLQIESANVQLDVQRSVLAGLHAASLDSGVVDIGVAPLLVGSGLGSGSSSSARFCSRSANKLSI